MVSSQSPLLKHTFYGLVLRSRTPFACRKYFNAMYHVSGLMLHSESML